MIVGEDIASYQLMTTIRCILERTDGKENRVKFLLGLVIPPPESFVFKQNLIEERVIKLRDLYKRKAISETDSSVRSRIAVNKYAFDAIAKSCGIEQDAF
jgi:hypothetical protein